MQRCERLYWRAMTSVLVLLNPNAGGGRALKLEADIRARIRTDYPTARFVVTSTVADGLALIGDTANDARIVVIGGDGTVNRMLPGIVGSNRELAVVPLGSGNGTRHGASTDGAQGPRRTQERTMPGSRNERRRLRPRRRRRRHASSPAGGNRRYGAFSATYWRSA